MEGMVRIDAQHGFLPPAQDPAWLQVILKRNRFSGSVYLAPPGPEGMLQALAIAHEFPYLKAVIPQLATNQLSTLVKLLPNPLLKSVRLLDPTPKKVEIPEGLFLEVSAADCWPVLDWYSGKLVIDGIPENAHRLGEHAYIKLTGFTLPVAEEARLALYAALRHPGPERLMFATGWPQHGHTWKECLAAFTQHLGAAPIALREQLLGGTACECYGLPDSTDEQAPTHSLVS